MNKEQLMDVILTPHQLSDKSMKAATEQNVYVFIVAKVATKYMIKLAVEHIFNVKVKNVCVLNRKGKQKRFKGVLGRQKSTKRAYVTLHKDQVIDLINAASVKQ